MPEDSVIDKLAKIIERELDVQEAVIAHPDTLRKIKALRIAKAVARTVESVATSIVEDGLFPDGAEPTDFGFTEENPRPMSKIGRLG